MIRKSTSRALKYVAVAFCLSVFLFADGIGAASPDFIGFALMEITAIYRDSATQWMLVFCLAIYFISFLVLERRIVDAAPHPNHPPFRGGKEIRTVFCGNLFNPNFWLAGLVLLALLPYALAYDRTWHSRQIPILMAGIIIGKAIATWARWRRDEVRQRMVFLIRLFLCLLAVSALWQPENSMIYQYHGIPRWRGTWDNPNLYGLLMGVGVVLAAGQIAGIRRWKMEDG